MIGMDIKKTIEENMKQAIRKFEARPDITTTFGDPVIGYADAKNPLFDLFFAKKLSEHPKRIYRPGNTVVVHFVPYEPGITEENRTGIAPSPKWNRAFIESMWLSMRLNGVIRETLDTVGRLSSCTNTPTDWDETVFHEEWSHKMAAYVAGMGHFGPGGSFHTKSGYAGRFSSIITDGIYAEPYEPLTKDQLEGVYRDLMRQCCYQGADDVVCSQEMIHLCPGKAISKDGIDRASCQAYCKTLDQHIPSPDVCGRCFGCK